MTEVLYTLITAAIVENVLFARAMGTHDMIIHSGTYKGIAQYTVGVALISLLGGALSWSLRIPLLRIEIWSLVRWPVVLLSVTFVFVILMLLNDRVLHIRSIKRNVFTTMTFNGAAFGTILLALASAERLFATLTYILGCSAGLGIAMFLLHAGREQMEYSKLPRSFQGLPIILIYIGILSLAICGLIGHQLPT